MRNAPALNGTEQRSRTAAELDDWHAHHDWEPRAAEQRKVENVSVDQLDDVRCDSVKMAMLLLRQSNEPDRQSRVWTV